MSLKYNECKRQCRYNYTPGERLEKGRALADEYGTLDTVNNDLERIKKDFKARIETHESKIQSLAEQVRSGYELRETLCFFEYNTPKAGRKTLKRADTLEVIGEEDMTGADTQIVMEAIDRESAEAGKPLAIAVADLPVEPWPEPIDDIAVVDSEVRQAFGSEKFSPHQCATFATWMRDIYYKNDALNEQQEVTIADIIALEPEAEVRKFLQWLEERARPGGRFVAVTLRNEHGVSTTEAEPKKKRRRRSSGAGTVDVPSDEGSRDDAGDDSKNNL